MPSCPLLQGRLPVVFGAGGSIGSKVAKAFAAEGVEVFLAGRSRESLKVVAEEIAAAGGRASPNTRSGGVCITEGHRGGGKDMTGHQVGTREEHRQARLALLAAEKEHTRRGDELARQRRALPWVKVDKEYIFDTASGEKTLPDLFAGRSQLLVYHFMFGPEWTEGCPVCSYWADNFNDVIVHLSQRDVTMICASRAPVDRLAAYQARMGWSFEWVSTGRSDFNYDYGVSIPGISAGASQPDMPRGIADKAAGARYNFTKDPFAPEMPGLSAFALDDGVIYHTYSCYARGLDAFNGANQLLDRTPKGRDEDALPVPIAWLRRHDEYEPAAAGSAIT